jgi:hypothetical protein
MQLQTKKFFHAGDVSQWFKASASLQKIEIPLLSLEIQNLVAVRKQPSAVVYRQFAGVEQHHLAVESG